MTEKARITINNFELFVNKSKTILAVALEANMYIPHLCHHPDLPDIGACRLCVVEIDGSEDIVTSCTTLVEDGMVIKTNTEQLDKMRRLSLELMLANHVDDCTDCPKYLKCELQALIQYLGVSTSRLRRTLNSVPINTENPLFVRDLNRCVVCGRCVRVCREIRGVGVLDYQKKKEGRTYIATEGDLALADVGCKFCGACIEVCPTGALRDKEGIFKAGLNRELTLIPCKQECPAGIDVPKYVRFMRDGKYSEAMAVIREKVPFPLSLGHVCLRFCENACRRKDVNTAVSIRALKRFAAENDTGLWKKKSSIKLATNNSVAIIGAGPAGLTAAYYLAKSGHKVTVFEQLPVAGGMLTTGITEYRLPRYVVEAEIEDIKAVGVEIKTNTRIESLEQLKDDGYEVILVAIGTDKGVRLPIPGSDLPGVLENIDFLRKVSLGKIVDIGNNVIVLGGGNVAFDCARTARRLGSKQVKIACLEPRERMTASKDEIEESLEEGIVVYNNLTFSKIVEENGKVFGVECREVASFGFDENQKLQIKIVEGSEFIIAADTVIFAVGQRPDLPVGFELRTGRGGTLIVNEETFETDRTGVFAVGDAVSGTASVIQAIASARKAAIAIDKYFGGEGSIEETLSPESDPSPSIGREKHFAYQERRPTGRLDIESRLNSFDEVDQGLDEKSAQSEAQRCLQCDLRPKLTKVRFWTEYGRK